MTSKVNSTKGVIVISPGLLEAASNRGGGIEETDLRVSEVISNHVPVTIISAHPNMVRPNSRVLLKDGLTIRYLNVPAPERYPIISRQETIRHMFLIVAYAIMAATFVLVHGGREKTLVVHNGLPGFLATISGRFRGTWIVLSEGNLTPWFRPYLGDKVRPFQRIRESFSLAYGKLVCFQSDIIRAQSENISSGMHAHGIEKEKIKIISAGVAINRFCPSNSINKGQLTVGYLGRLVPEKGAEKLVNLMKRMSSSDPSVRFMVFGDGILRKDLEGLSNLHHLGQVPRDQVPEHLDKVDLVVFFQKEPGLAELEAMSSGKVVITLDTQENAKVIDNWSNGVLCSPEIESYIGAIHRIEKDRTLMKDIAVKARNRVVENYSWQTIGERFLDIIERRA